MRRAAAIGLVLAALVAVTPAQAGERPVVSGTPLPAEPNTRVVPGVSGASTVFDLDGDGIRELIRIVAQPNRPGLAAVEVVTVNDDGVPSRLWTAPLRRATSVDEQQFFRGVLGIDSDDMTPIRLAEDMHEFVVAGVAGTPRLLVVAQGLAPRAGDTECCLTIWQVELSDSLHGLRLMGRFQRAGDEVKAADLDGDGTDELVVKEPSQGPSANKTPERVRIYRSQGAAYASADSVFDLPSGSLFGVGETDGRSGEEVLGMVGGEGAFLALIRVSLLDDEPQLELIEVDGRNPLVLRREGGEVVLTDRDGRGVGTYRWPAFGVLEPVQKWSVAGEAIATFGSGDDARILVAPDQVNPGGALDVIDPPEIGFPNLPRRLIHFPSDIVEATPFLGPAPPGIGPDDAWIYAGQLISSRRPHICQTAPLVCTLELTIRPISRLAGVRPVGAVGPGDAWAVIERDPSGGPPGAAVFGAETLVGPTASVLDPAEPALSPTFRGMTVADDNHLLAHPDSAIEAEVIGPEGTLLVSVDGRLQEAIGGTIDSRDGLGRTDTLTVDLRRRTTSATRFTLRLVAITPQGRVAQGTWIVEIIPEAPPLTVRLPDSVVGTEGLTGMTDARATVTVGGEEVAVAADGTFSAPLPVAVLPTPVRVVATDPLGQETVAVVSVVAPVDYRQLPWVPLVVGLTVAGGLIWWIRAPLRRPPAAKPTESTGTFEDIEA